jgi:hypothetical protein
MTRGRWQAGWLVAAVLVGAGAGPDVGLPVASEVEVAAFLPRLNAAASRTDRLALCGMVSFPVQVGSPGRRQAALVRDVRQCKARFSDVFTPALLRSMAGLTMAGLRPSNRMFSAENGLYWIGKYYGGPQGEAPLHVDFSDARFWKVGLVGIVRE